jgi:membrane associated rhomboid family serine protease
MIPISDDNPTSSPPILTVAFIVVCVAVFIWQVSLDADAAVKAVFAFGMVPAVLFGSASLPDDVAILPPAATVLTSMFLHGSLMHLLGNMLYLWIFGNNVEDAMGSMRFVVFYLLCGTVAAMTQAIAAPVAEIPMIGASGAISGVLGAYILLDPHARVRIVIPIGFYPHLTYLPAMLALGLWMGLQIMSSLMTPPDQGGTAWFAHIGGFVAGMLLIPFFKRRGVRFFQTPRRR